MAATVALPRPIIVSSSTPTALRLWPEWLTLFLYASLVAFAIPFHEPWADEAQAWQLAGHTSFLHLFTTNLRYEGHPALWYLLLKSLQHCGVTYVGMHWFSGLIATISAALLIFRAPFPRIARLTLPFTFFLAYQYSVVARSYVLIPLLLFLAAMAWKQSNALKPALWLGLLANVELHATTVSVGLALIYYLQTRNCRHEVKHRTAAIVLFLMLLVVATLTVLPQPKDLLVSLPMDGVSTTAKPLVIVIRCIVYLSLGLVAFPWQIGVVCLAALLWALRGAVPWYYLVPLAFLAAFSAYYFIFWHLGIMTVSCIVLAWIAWPIRAKTKWARTIALSATALIAGIQIAYTADAVICDHYSPYSGDLAAAEYLSPFVRRGTPIAVTYVKEAKAGSFFEVGLRPYIPSPIFINEPDPFWKFSTAEHSRIAFEASLKQHPPIVLVEYSDVRSRPFDLEREKYSRAVSHLQGEGYVLTHVFCGVRPEAFRKRKSPCHLIFELPSGAAQSNFPEPDIPKRSAR